VAISDECWWDILHNGHHAWYQRALIAGDFKPGLTPRGDYVVDEAGRAGDPAHVPHCATCGEVPDVNALEALERASGKTDFLEEYRSRRREWPAPTSALTCWWCNCPETADPVKVAAAAAEKRAAARRGATVAAETATIIPSKEEAFLCAKCASYLQGRVK